MKNVMTWTIGLGLIALTGCHDFTITLDDQGGIDVDVDVDAAFDDGHEDGLNDLTPLASALGQVVEMGPGSMMVVNQSWAASLLTGGATHRVEWTENTICLTTDFSNPDLSPLEPYVWENCIDLRVPDTGTLTAYTADGAVLSDGSVDLTFDYVLYSDGTSAIMHAADPIPVADEGGSISEIFLNTLDGDAYGAAIGLDLPSPEPIPASPAVAAVALLAIAICVEEVMIDYYDYPIYGVCRAIHGKGPEPSN